LARLACRAGREGAHVVEAGQPLPVGLAGAEERTSPFRLGRERAAGRPGAMPARPGLVADASRVSVGPPDSRQPSLTRPPPCAPRGRREASPRAGERVEGDSLAAPLDHLPRDAGIEVRRLHDLRPLMTHGTSSERSGSTLVGDLLGFPVLGLIAAPQAHSRSSIASIGSVRRVSAIATQHERRHRADDIVGSQQPSEERRKGRSHARRAAGADVVGIEEQDEHRARTLPACARDDARVSGCGPAEAPRRPGRG